MRQILSAAVVVGLLGCQTEPYREYALAMASIAASKERVQVAQAAALKELASNSRDPTVTALAIFMLGGAGGLNGGQQYQNPAPPANEALQWAQVLLGPISNVMIGYWGYHLGKTQSNNAADVSIAGYGAMQGIAQSGFNAVGQFKPVPIDWSTFPPVNTTTTTVDINNRDGQVVVGGNGTQTPAVIPPVVVVPPVVVTNP